jgi:hypothetical protein
MVEAGDSTGRKEEPQSRSGRRSKVSRAMNKLETDSHMYCEENLFREREYVGRKVDWSAGWKSPLSSDLKIWPASQLQPTQWLTVNHATCKVKQREVGIKQPDPETSVP